MNMAQQGQAPGLEGHERSVSSDDDVQNTSEADMEKAPHLPTNMS